MSKKNDRDFVFLIWKDPVKRDNYIVGELSKNGQYEFKYTNQIKDAMKAGYKPFISMDDINKTYTNDLLFPIFSSRLPDKKRRGINRILDKYGLDEYNEYELLKRSGTRLPIDTLEFIDPIFEDDDNIEIKRDFYLSGVRHWMNCDGVDCEKVTDLDLGLKLRLVPEPENKFDSYAIRVFDDNNRLIGYVPRYYSEPVNKRIIDGYKCVCTVIEVNKDNNCNECIKVRLEILNSKMN